MNITIIGTGNVATILGKKVLDAGHHVVQVCGRNKNATVALAETLQAMPVYDASNLSAEGDIYIIAVSDNAIREISGQLTVKNKMVVHTAGSVSKLVLDRVSKNYGVLYPLQSLRKEMKILPQIPFLVDANTADDLTLIYDFAKTISDHVQVADDQQRLRTHLAAVIVSNFSNHLYTLAEMYCKKEKVDFALLTPLIHEVAGRLQSHTPAEMQTGPAIRNDQRTIETHLKLLSDYPEIKNLYAYFSKSIQAFYEKTT